MNYWSHGEFTENGKRTGQYFVEYSGDIDAAFSNSALKNEACKLKKLQFSDSSGLILDAPKITGYYPVGTNDINVSATNGAVTHKCVGTFTSKGTVLIPYSAELLNILLSAKATVHFEDTSRSYTFTIPKGFSSVWEKRTNKTNIL